MFNGSKGNTGAKINAYRPIIPPPLPQRAWPAQYLRWHKLLSPRYTYTVFWYIHWISLFDHHNIKIQWFIYFIHFNMVSLLHIIWTWFLKVMCFLLHWSQFLTLLNFHLFFEHINKYDQQCSTFTCIIVINEKRAISL